MLTTPLVGGTQGTPRLDERVSCPLRICINSVSLTLLVIVVLLHDIYTLNSIRSTLGSFILYDIPTRLSTFSRMISPDCRKQK